MLLPEKDAFYNNLITEDITEADYMHAKRVCKYFEVKHSDEYPDLYFKTGALLLAGVFVNFRKMYSEIYELDSAKFLSTPGLA